MKKTLLILLLFISFLAQTQTLTLFTKPTCNNCRYTKYMLQKNGIAFRDFSLDEQANGTEMLKKIKSAGYTGKIHLPVIFENDTILLHPKLPYNDSTLFFVVEKIIAKKQLYIPDSTKTEIILPDNEDGGDCVMDTVQKPQKPFK